VDGEPEITFQIIGRSPELRAQPFEIIKISSRSTKCGARAMASKPTSNASEAPVYPTANSRRYTAGFLAAVIVGFLGLFLSSASMGPAGAAMSRVALVIGNSHYDRASTLPNPVNDAKEIARTLEKIGFDKVILTTDLKLDETRSALKQFSEIADGADIAFLYYAGHGIEVSGVNYLVPTDATLRSDRAVEFELISLDLVMHSLEGARALKIVLLDACRDNPFVQQMAMNGGRTRSLGRGLGRVDRTPPNTVVVYAAAAGATAEDGRGDHSPFASALISHLPTPRLDVRFLIGRIRDSVMSATSSSQEPFIYASLGGRELSLSDGPAQTDAFGRPPSSPGGADEELIFWDSVRSSKSAEVLSTYLRRYPNGRFADLARARLEEIKKSIGTASLGNAAQAGAGPVAGPAVGPPLKIAVVGPMTGPNAVFGDQMRRGAELAVEHANAQGGILGRRIELVIGDDVSDPKQGVSVANRMVAYGVSAVVGHFNSGVTVPTSEIYAENGVLQITPSATNPKVTERGLWNIFRTCGRDDQQGILWANYASSNLRGKKIAIVHDKTTYGQGLVDAAKRNMNAVGIREVLYEGINTGAKDYSALVSKIVFRRGTLTPYEG